MAVNPIPQPNERLIVVFETEQEAEAMVVRGLLESAGIDAEIGGSENAPDAFPVGAVGVLVREENAEQARQLIAAYRRSPEQENAEEADFDETAVQSSENPSEDQADGK